MSPRTLLRLDGCGALLSAVLLGLVLPQFPTFFGMPPATLYFLAVWPVGFAGYDFIVLRQRLANYAPFLRGIAIANGLYCLLSIGMLGYHYLTLTIWGWAYFVGELIIVLTLAGIEWRAAAEQ